MDSNRRPGGPRLALLYPGHSVLMELTRGRHTLWSGLWQWEVRLDGVLVPPTSVWEPTCWVSDDDVDYLELSIGLGDGLRIERHMALARKDGFVLLADAVMSQRPGMIDYRGRLPLSPGVVFQPSGEACEGYLVAKPPRRTVVLPRGRRQPTGNPRATNGNGKPAGTRMARVLPLGLPEWRRDPRPGRLAAVSQGLELHQTVSGRRLFAPLFIDLDRGRLARRLTWRQLTVAQSMEVCPADLAVGYRVAIGTKQWLIYRSLGEKGNRTLLGHNLSTEMLVARFDRKGEVETIVEIE